MLNPETRATLEDLYREYKEPVRSPTSLRESLPSLVIFHYRRRRKGRRWRRQQQEMQYVHWRWQCGNKLIHPPSSLKAHYSTGAAARGFTSTISEPVTENVAGMFLFSPCSYLLAWYVRTFSHSNNRPWHAEIWTNQEERSEEMTMLSANIITLSLSVTGYVRLHTNLGDLNIELHCDKVRI